MKRIFGIGGGGREHALAQAMSKSEGVEQLWAPGNPGIASLPGCSVVDIPVTDLERLAAFASDTRPDLTVVGPEGPLAAGIVDVFRERGLPIIGPTRAAARIETDKLFALMLMHRCGVPTGRYRAFWPTTPEDVADVERYALTVCDWDGRVVIKPNGLTGGKGVRVCTCAEHVRDAIRALTAAYAGAPIVVMEHLGAGQEFLDLGQRGLWRVEHDVFGLGGLPHLLGPVGPRGLDDLLGRPEGGPGRDVHGPDRGAAGQARQHLAVADLRLASRRGEPECARPASSSGRASRRLRSSSHAAP